MTHTDDRDPRGRPHRACRGPVFWHPCSVCGKIDAPFGIDVDRKRDKLGTWYCAEHRPI